MISARQIQEILAQYAKFGWKLERVLLTGELKKHLADFAFDSAVFDSEIDAAWFTRASGTDKTAWEIRRLSVTPYALFELFENGEDEEFCNQKRREMESKLRNGK